MYRLPLVLCAFFVVACGQTVSHTKDEFSGSEFQYYDRSDRTRMIANLYDATDLMYAPLAVKKERIGLDLDAEMFAAMSEESMIADPDTAGEQAAANLAFIDRMTKRIARFEDSHFRLRMKNPVNRISNGLLVKEVEGRFFVVGLKPKMMAYNNNMDGTEVFSQISLGDEVLGIDGRDVEEVVQDLVPFRHASSRLAARGDAVFSLTSRNFSLPETSRSTWLIRHRDGQEQSYALPWYVQFLRVSEGRPHIDSTRLDVERYVTDRDIASIHDIRMKQSAEEGVAPFEWQSPAIGYDIYQPLSGMDQIQEYHVEDELVVRLGQIEQAGRVYGVMQLFSFNELQVSKDGKTFPIEDVMGDFIAQLKEQNRPLILDLRENGGGDPNLSDTLLSLLTEQGKAYASHSVSFRLTRQVRAVLESSTMFDSSYDPESYELMPAAHHEIKLAAEARQTHTPVFASEASILPAPQVGGYDLPIVVLTSPNCVSACDIAVMNFAANKRAIVLGTQTNGTGAGFRSTVPVPVAEYSEPRGLFYLRFPNFLFGAPGDLDVLIDRSEGAAVRRSSENVPTVADVTYHDTLEDYLDQSRGWVAKAIAVLDSQAAGQIAP